jgi:L-seryl-tRNA(Ser) seleniumtransferase
MRVHSSNFKVIGFTESVELHELTNLAHQHDLIVIDDLGSGTFLYTSEFGLEREPTIQESIKSGADIVTFSGDKLLGGPQAGLIIGRKILIEQLKGHPLARALRPDKLCIAGLSVTLKQYRDEQALDKIPVWQMIAMPLDVIKNRAQAWQTVLGGTIIEAESTVGGGSLPGNSLATWVLAMDIPKIDDFAAKLRQAETPIIGRIHDNRLLLDPRTVLPEQDQLLVETLKATMKSMAS